MKTLFIFICFVIAACAASPTTLTAPTTPEASAQPSAGNVTIPTQKVQNDIFRRNE